MFGGRLTHLGSEGSRDRTHGLSPSVVCCNPCGLTKRPDKRERRSMPIRLSYFRAISRKSAARQRCKSRSVRAFPLGSLKGR